jgi:pyruvate ferredoxin oxidoreductase gamma subunit
LDEAIKKKFAKKEMLLQKNLDTIKVAYDRAKEYAKSNNYIPAVMA